MLVERILRRASGIPGMRSLWQRYPIGDLSTRVDYGVSQRPHYTYGTYHAARMAKLLGLTRISVIEFGVAGGRGLRVLEDVAAEVSAYFGIGISVYGFDSGEGMPPAVDYRDQPHTWNQGFFKMDEAKLRSSLKSSTRLMLGNVAQTVPALIERGNIDPLGFIAFDLDYYSSTMQAFNIFNGDHHTRLPRIYCYFDDIVFPAIACHNEYTGELCAIRDFNTQNETHKICPIHLLRYHFPYPSQWHDQMYVMHDFNHPLYTKEIVLTTDLASRHLPL